MTKKAYRILQDLDWHLLRRPPSYVEPLVVVCLLVQSLGSFADTCVKYHKRAPVRAVCGRVTNILGEKVKDAEITLTGDNDSVIFHTKSDDKGFFSFGSTPKGNYTLHVNAPGWQEAQRDLEVTDKDGKKCKPQIDVGLGLRFCSTGVYVKGVDKPSDLDPDFR